MSEEQVKISTDDLKEYSLFVAMPTYGGQLSTVCANSLIQLGIICATYGIRARFEFITNESLVQRARNYLAHKFVKSDFTHMIFIDSDIQFDPWNVLLMLGTQTKFSDKYDVLAAPYTKKGIDWNKVSQYDKMVANKNDLEYLCGDFVFAHAGDPASASLHEPFEVLEAGTGFMLIPKYVLTQFAESFNMLKYRPDHNKTVEFNGSEEITAFFHCEIDDKSKRYLSEDYFFCKKVREMGRKVHLVPYIELVHNGSYDFKGSLVKEFQAVAEYNNSKSSEKKKSNKPKK